MEKELELLIHISAPSTVRDDIKYRNQVIALTRFEPATTFKIYPVDEDERLPNNNVENDASSALPDQATVPESGDVVHETPYRKTWSVPPSLSSGGSIVPADSTRNSLDHEASQPTSPRRYKNISAVNRSPHAVRHHNPPYKNPLRPKVNPDVQVLRTPVDLPRPRTAPESRPFRLSPLRSSHKRSRSESDSFETPPSVVSETQQFVPNSMEDSVMEDSMEHNISYAGTPGGAPALLSTPEVANLQTTSQEAHDLSSPSPHKRQRLEPWPPPAQTDTSDDLPMPEASATNFDIVKPDWDEVMADLEDVRRTFDEVQADLDQCLANRKELEVVSSSSFSRTKSPTPSPPSKGPIVHFPGSMPPPPTRPSASSEATRKRPRDTSQSSPHSPPSSKKPRPQTSTISPRVQHHFPTIAALPQHIIPDDPATSSDPFITHVTNKLEQIERRLTIPGYFTPELVRQTRPLEKLDRGHWLMRTTIIPAPSDGSQGDGTELWDCLVLNGRGACEWTERQFYKFWEYLVRMVGGGNAGWDVRCFWEEVTLVGNKEGGNSSRTSSKQTTQISGSTTQSGPHSSSSSSDKAQQQQVAAPDDKTSISSASEQTPRMQILVQIFCPGELMPYVWILLYLASDARVKGMGMEWIRGHDEVVVTMKGERQGGQVRRGVENGGRIVDW